jgi:hypothetical protein
MCYVVGGALRKYAVMDGWPPIIDFFFLPGDFRVPRSTPALLGGRRDPERTNVARYQRKGSISAADADTRASDVGSEELRSFQTHFFRC